MDKTSVVKGCALASMPNTIALSCRLPALAAVLVLWNSVSSANVLCTSYCQLWVNMWWNHGTRALKRVPTRP